MHSTLSSTSDDLRPGGQFYTVMQSPEGQTFPGMGCYLELVENERLVWTNALLPSFRPAPSVSVPGQENVGAFYFTGIVELAEHGNGTLDRATVRHADEAGRARHEAMQFEQGWGAALDQLVAYSKTMWPPP